MRNLLNPKWLLAINTLPILLLFLLFWGDYSIIKTLLTEDNLAYWKGFGLILFALSILNFGYTLLCIIKALKVSIYYAIISLIVYTIFIFLYNVHSRHIIPSDIPRWMLSGDLLLYVGTFLMPTLIHALFIIVIKLTSANKNHKAWKNFLSAVAVPIVWYIFFQVIAPLWQTVDSRFSEHAFIILMIIGVIIFLFFLIRGIYILSLQKDGKWKKYQLFWKIPIAIIFPLLGLVVNRGYLFRGFTGNDTGIFGDFSSPWFFVLACINGILICLPNTKHKRYRILLYAGRSITLTYTLYFFMVFLPFLPFSIIAIIAVGTGFLMLTPLVLFVIHLQELTSDFSFLKQHFSKPLLFGISIFGFLIIPLSIIGAYQKDRHVLHETLDYIYHPDYSKDYNIDKKSLQKTLHVITSNKDRRNDFIFGNQTPYLSPLFNWIVLDNLTLSDAKINTIERIFFNTPSFGIRRSENLVNEGVGISNISSNSTYNKEANYWTSWIDIEITNANSDRFQSEYATTIDLPEGCWISDYYLNIGDRKEMGILAEKKSAMWVFSQIRNVRRDPGLLHYLTGNKVSFRVFPFAKNEVRKTGIQLVHKEPVTLDIDAHEVILGNANSQIESETIQSDHIAYVSVSDKERLEHTKRNPYYHFVIDMSQDKDSLRSHYEDLITQFLEKQPLASQPKISFTNSFTNTIPLDNVWKNTLNGMAFEGGFYLERAVKKILFNAHTEPSNSYPVIIVVSDDIQNSIIEKDFKDFKMAFPESDIFYHLNTSGQLASHSLTHTPKRAIDGHAIVDVHHAVLAWPNTKEPLAYLTDNNAPSIVLKSPIFDIIEKDIQSKNWNSGLLLQGKWISHTLYPKIAEDEWNQQVKYSFMSQIMTPLTSYIALENEAQKAILLKKQKEVLSGKKSFDLNEDTQRMSEPSLFILLILIGMFILIKRKGIKLL
ncbi:MSEP-CTERM sorting domain-containing protein [Winogradskyella sp.]|uniref:MSEP-CTERM sorting domain-containing protein n=1 Tax=Winogradskyella sp. TaxID=1883156 RepID=UPI003BA893A6